jgi:hypothetical protein
MKQNSGTEFRAGIFGAELYEFNMLTYCKHIFTFTTFNPAWVLCHFKPSFDVNILNLSHKSCYEICPLIFVTKHPFLSNYDHRHTWINRYKTTHFCGFCP